MQNEEQYSSAKNNILQITKELKNHFIKGEFIDPDKNFKELLTKIIDVFEKDEIVSEIVNNEEMHQKYKQKYEEAVDYIKILESNKIDKKISFGKLISLKGELGENNNNHNNFDLNKSTTSALHFENLSNNGENYYIAESPEIGNSNYKNKLRQSSNIARLNRESQIIRELSSSNIETNKSLFIYGMEPEKLKDEYIRIFEEKKNLEHEYLIAQEKLSKLELVDSDYQEALMHIENLTEKSKHANEDIYNLKERIRKIGNENIELINLNNQYIEAIKTFYSENGDKKNKFFNENSKVKHLEKELVKASKSIFELKKQVENVNEKFVKEQEERFYVEKQYEDYIYDQENELAKVKIENQKNLRENLFEKLFDSKQNSNRLDFFYNEETNKIEIFVNEEKIIDIENTKPLNNSNLDYNTINENNQESFNELQNNFDGKLKFNNSNNEDNNNLNENQIDNSRKSVASFLNVIKRKYSMDDPQIRKKRLLSEISFSNMDNDQSQYIDDIQTKEDFKYFKNENLNQNSTKDKLNAELTLNAKSDSRNNIANAEFNTELNNCIVEENSKNNTSKFNENSLMYNNADAANGSKNNFFPINIQTPKKVIPDYSQEFIGRNTSISKTDNYEIMFNCKSPNTNIDIFNTPVNVENHKDFNSFKSPSFFNSNCDAAENYYLSNNKNEETTFINRQESKKTNTLFIYEKKTNRRVNSFVKRKSVSFITKREKQSNSITFANEVKQMFVSNNLQNDKQGNNGIDLNNLQNGKQGNNHIEFNNTLNLKSIDSIKNLKNSTSEFNMRKESDEIKKKNLRNSKTNFRPRHTRAYNSILKSENFLHNIKNRLKSDQVQKFVLENLKVHENLENEKQTKDTKEGINNLNNVQTKLNNVENPLFKSTNNSFLNDSSFNYDAVRRTTINNFNLISKKLSSIPNGVNMYQTINDNMDNNFNNNINISFEKDPNNENSNNNSYSELQNDFYHNIKSINLINSNNKNFNLEDLIQDEKIISENFLDNNHTKQTNKNNSYNNNDLPINKRINYEQDCSFIDNSNVNNIEKEINNSEKNISIDNFDMHDYAKQLDQFIEGSADKTKRVSIVEIERSVDISIHCSAEKRIKPEIEQMKENSFIEQNPKNENLDNDVDNKDKNVFVDNEFIEKLSSLKQNEFKGKKDSRNKYKKNHKKLHRKSQSNINPSTINLDLLNKIIKKNKPAKKKEKKDKTTSYKNDIYEIKNNSKQEKIENTILNENNAISENDEISCISKKDDNNFDHEIKNNLFYHEISNDNNIITNSINNKFSVKNTKNKSIDKDLRTSNLSKISLSDNTIINFREKSNPVKFDSEFQLIKNFKKKLNDDSEKTDLKTNFKSNFKLIENSDLVQTKFFDKTEEFKNTLNSTNSNKLHLLSSNNFNKINPLIKYKSKACLNPIQSLSDKENLNSLTNKHEVEKCIKNIDLKSFILNYKNKRDNNDSQNKNKKSFIDTEKQNNYESIYNKSESDNNTNLGNEPNPINKTFKKSFDNTNFTKKIFDDFKINNRNNIRDRIFSENERFNPDSNRVFSTNNITTNHNYSKYTINLVSSQDTSFNNNMHYSSRNKDNCFSKDNFFKKADFNRKKNKSRKDKCLENTINIDNKKQKVFNENGLFTNYDPYELDENSKENTFYEDKSKSVNNSKQQIDNNHINKGPIGNFFSNNLLYRKFNDKKKINRDFILNKARMGSKSSKNLYEESIFNNNLIEKNEYIKSKLNKIDKKNFLNHYYGEINKQKVFDNIAIESNINNFCIVSSIKRDSNNSKLLFKNKERNYNIDKLILNNKGNIEDKEYSSNDYLITFNNFENHDVYKNNEFNSNYNNSSSNSFTDNEIENNQKIQAQNLDKGKENLNNAYAHKRELIRDFNENKSSHNMNSKYNFEVLNVENEEFTNSVNEEKIKINLLDNNCEQTDLITNNGYKAIKNKIYGIDKISDISIHYRKNILLNFCKEKAILLNNQIYLDTKNTEFESTLYKDTIKEKKKDKNLTFLDGNNHPLYKTNVSFKNMRNETSFSSKKDKQYVFDNKSYMQDSTILKELPKSKCQRCSIF